jgi:predicted nucleic acid-binding protein
MRTVVDTDFLSAFIKINRVELIYKALETDKLYVTQAVFEELAKAPFFDHIAELMEKIVLISIDKLNKNVQSAKFGKGELESISYALETNSVLLTNDKKAGEFAEDSGVKVLDIVSFLLLCREIDLLGVDDIKNILVLLNKYDYMDFSQEQRRLLLK